MIALGLAEKATGIVHLLDDRGRPDCGFRSPYLQLVAVSEPSFELEDVRCKECVDLANRRALGMGMRRGA